MKDNERNWTSFRESSKSLLNREDLRTKEGIFYKIMFETGEYYYGISRHSFKRRYQSQNLAGGKSLKYKARCCGWDARILASDLGWEELAELEALVVTKELIRDKFCLNKNLGGQYSARRFDGGSAKNITLVDPHGNHHTFRSGAEAAKEIGCTWSEVSTVRKGLKSHCHGWHLQGVKPDKNNKPKKIELRRELPDGKVERKSWDSMSQCAREIGSTTGNLRKMLDGKRNECKGWHPIGTKLKKKNKSITLSTMLPDGKVKTKTWNSYSECAEEICSHTTGVSMVDRGKSLHCNGWTLPINSLPRKICLTKNGKTKTWGSQLDCSSELGYSIFDVNCVDTGYKASLGGWMSVKHIDEKANIVCTETGIKYISVGEAAKHKGLCAKNVYHQLQKKNKSENTTTLKRIKK